LFNHVTNPLSIGAPSIPATRDFVGNEINILLENARF
jgi:hypothetical protein